MKKMQMIRVWTLNSLPTSCIEKCNSVDDYSYRKVRITPRMWRNNTENYGRKLVTKPERN